jgi:soluble lytic murein transglycosylase
MHRLISQTPFAPVRSQAMRHRREPLPPSSRRAPLPVSSRSPLPVRSRRAACLLRCLLVTALLGPLAGGQQAQAAANADTASERVQQQRDAFRVVYPEAARGNWGPAKAQASLLKDYLLWTDIRGAYLKATIASTPRADIEAFLQQHGTLKPARDLRYRYALQLAKTGQTTAYRSLYREYYSTLGDAKLDCYALRGDIRDQNTDDILQRSEPLWLVGKSQVSECDPVFSYLKKTGQLDEALYRKRYDIAITDRNFSLAKYLAKSLGSATQRDAANWKKARNQPEALLKASPTAAQTLYALERLSYREPELANDYWRALRTEHSFSKSQQRAIEQHIALWAVRRQSKLAPQLVSQLPKGAVSEDIRTWQLRALLDARDWPAVIDTINAAPETMRDQEVWQYWLGSALGQQGQDKKARPVLKALATKRGYYGFLAADALHSDYSFEHKSMQRDAQLIAELRKNTALQRAFELFTVGFDGKGRSEWDATVASLSKQEQQQAAILAHDLGWHSRAIALAATTGHFNDLDIRYPLPYRRSFEKYAARASIRNSWAYGIARSESLFMRDIRSGAGAVGLMQLMPATGKATAKSLRIPYYGVSTLIQPDSNIHLGTAYLGKMYKYFNENPVLATAAYNAGPGNVSRWLKKTDKADARIWIENIPFNETRKYVRRVLEADTVFYWRLTGEQQRISHSLPRIVGTANNGDKVASYDRQ